MSCTTDDMGALATPPAARRRDESGRRRPHHEFTASKAARHPARWKDGTVAPARDYSFWGRPPPGKMGREEGGPSTGLPLLRPPATRRVRREEGGPSTGLPLLGSPGTRGKEKTREGKKKREPTVGSSLFLPCAQYRAKFADPEGKISRLWGKN